MGRLDSGTGEVGVGRTADGAKGGEGAKRHECGGVSGTFPARGAWMLLVGGESRRGLCAWRVRMAVGVAVGLGCSGGGAAQRVTAAVKAAVAGGVRAWRSRVLSVVHGEGGCGEVWLVG